MRRVKVDTRAKAADTVMYTSETFVDYPDVYVSDTRFSATKRVTDANPCQREYKWGHRILFAYTNTDGVRLQGILAIPDDIQKGQRRPMLVNFYEKVSQTLHKHYAPRYATGAATVLTEMVSRGYLEMEPDIHFNGRTTGSDMLECVEAAVRKVVELGYADPARIGLQGHSFSGYGSAYIATRSKMFAAVACGAGTMNLASDHNRLWGWSDLNRNGSGDNANGYNIHRTGEIWHESV
ncbi:MAG: prolyl oligopeptidase family serine peptidase [Fuerstiella sp.]|nr:hypothetical protein [Fuerstiella sp.]